MIDDAARYAGDLLIRKLRSAVDLDAEEAGALAGALVPGRMVKPRRDLVREGARPGSAMLIVSGWACQYRTMEDGRRQIVSFLIPGDLCGLHDMLLPQMDHSIGALRPVRCAELPAQAIDRLSEQYPRLRQAFRHQMLTAMSVQREWTVSIGQRNSLERVGHLICELFLRMRAIGLARGQSYDFPLTQSDIAEATGLTQIHVNRTIRQLRMLGLIEIADRVVTIPDLKALTRASLFSAAYLHLIDGSSVDAKISQASEIGF